LHTVADPHQQPAVRPRRRKRTGLLAFLLIILALLGAVVYPPTFLFVVRQVLAFEAWRYGFSLSIGQMDGSVTGPIWLYHTRFSHNSVAGTSTMLEIDRAHTSFAWKHLLWKRDERVWNDLTMDGVRGTIDLPTETQPAPKRAGSFLHPLFPLYPYGSGKVPRLVMPSSLTLSHASIVIQHREGSVRLDDIDLQASNLEAGHLVIGALSVHEPWMTGVFSNCRGALLLEDSKLLLSDMKLTDALTIASASADLPELLRGELQMKFALNAFSGNIEGELKSGEHAEHLIFESSGTFANISVAQLAAFLGEDADGSITEGKFDFRGSPRDLTKATFTTFFKAGNFRWGARRWNSLVAGATYVNRRLRIPEFELRQAHNTLTLKGDMSLPDNWHEWWKTDFSFAVAAKLDNLSELSALLGSGFGDIFGKLTIDGSVRGDNASFDGQLIVSGSHLSFRKAPLDELQAAIKLQGNEIQVTNAEFTHGDDFLRAHGVVNILGEKRYWGEIKANVADLALYSAFLQPPISPEAFGGGLMLDWSGDGAASAHSGAFSVRLNRIHPLGAADGADPADAWQPIDLTAEGTYSPDSIFFSNLVLGNGQTTLASRVVATPRSLSLQSMKMLHGKAVWLTGDAQVPLNVWAAWQNPGTASWWNFESPCKLDLKLDRLSIQDALFLSGHQQPFNGELTGLLKSDGTLAKLTADGHLVIKNAGGTVPAGTLKGASGTLDFKGDAMTVTSGTGDWNAVGWTASGTVTAADVRKPALDLSINLPAAPLTLGDGAEATAALDLHATGTPDALALSGSAQLQTLKSNRAISIESLIASGSSTLDAPLPAISLAAPPAWTLDIQVTGNASVELANTSGHASPSLELTGSIAAPSVFGSIEVSGFTLSEGPDHLTIQDGALFLNRADVPNSALFLVTAGNTAGQDFRGYLTGTLIDRRFSSDPDVSAWLPGHADLSDFPARPISLDLGTPYAWDAAFALRWYPVMGFNSPTSLTPAIP